MEKMKCPYCECRVLMSDVENDDGMCPECGAPLMGSHIFDHVEDDDPYDDDDSSLADDDDD